MTSQSSINIYAAPHSRESMKAQNAWLLFAMGWISTIATLAIVLVGPAVAARFDIVIPAAAHVQTGALHWPQRHAASVRSDVRDREQCGRAPHAHLSVDDGGLRRRAHRGTQPYRTSHGVPSARSAIHGCRYPGHRKCSGPRDCPRHHPRHCALAAPAWRRRSSQRRLLGGVRASVDTSLCGDEQTPYNRHI